MTTELTQKTIDIVSVYLARNSISVAEVPELIRLVHSALKDVDDAGAPAPERPTARVSVESTVTPDYIISLEDGKPYKTLGRHLTSRGLTPDQYRAKWGLDPTYPMIAPNYAAKRAKIARGALVRGRLRKDSDDEGGADPDLGPLAQLMEWKKPTPGPGDP
ncbi:MucR family transcriptional regulator [Methylobacterium oryzisoli]|uniref:MucR family transcriptional regulator n=1 Tax=Methylobacterium oryzisoli TaxID=3385502 RepID=UPI0038917B11